VVGDSGGFGTLSPPRQHAQHPLVLHSTTHKTSHNVSQSPQQSRGGCVEGSSGALGIVAVSAKFLEVCSRWREAAPGHSFNFFFSAFSMPSLYAHLSLTLPLALTRFSLYHDKTGAVAIFLRGIRQVPFSEEYASHLGRQNFLFFPPLSSCPLSLPRHGGLSSPQVHHQQQRQQE